MSKSSMRKGIEIEQEVSVILDNLFSDKRNKKKSFPKYSDEHGEHELCDYCVAVKNNLLLFQIKARVNSDPYSLVYSEDMIGNSKEAERRSDKIKEIYKQLINPTLREVINYNSVSPKWIKNKFDSIYLIGILQVCDDGLEASERVDLGLYGYRLRDRFSNVNISIHVFMRDFIESIKDKNSFNFIKYLDFRLDFLNHNPKLHAANSDFDLYKVYKKEKDKLIKLLNEDNATGIMLSEEFRDI